MDIKNLEGKVYNDYKFISRISYGSFGVVYLAECLKDGKRYAIKVESSRSMNSQIYFQYDTYIYIHSLYRQHSFKIPPIPNIYGMYSNKDLTFFVMDLLGPSLSDVFRKHDRDLSPTKIIDYAKQMIEIIKKIHMMSFVHRDIKPQNFVFTNNQEKQLKLVDFGLAKKIALKNQRNKVRQSSKVIGTLRYASISAHQGKALGRKDDIQSLVYVIIYLTKGSLPWQGMKGRTENQKDDLVYKMKKTISAKILCDKLPTAFQKLVNYVRDEDFFDKQQSYDQLLEYLDESLVEQTLKEKEIRQKEWWDVDFQIRQSSQIFNPLKINVESPLTAQKKTSSNQATNTYDQKSLKDEVNNLATLTKKKPIKIPSIKKQFALNEDSDSQVPPQVQKNRKKSNFIDDQDEN